MNFFDIKGRPAEAALRGVEKAIAPAQPFWSGPGGALMAVDDPRLVSGAAVLGNRMPEPLSWKASVLVAQFPLTLTRSTGSYREPLTFVADPVGLPLGAYTATLRVTATTALNIPVANPTQTLTFTLWVVERVERVYLPIVMRNH